MLQRSRVAMVIACVDATRNDSVGGYSIHGPLTSHLDKTLQEANISLEEAPTPLVVICDPGKVGSLNTCRSSRWQTITQRVLDSERQWCPG